MTHSFCALCFMQDTMFGEQFNGVYIQHWFEWSIAICRQLRVFATVDVAGFARILWAKLQIYCNTDQQLLNDWTFQTYNCLLWFVRSSNVMNANSPFEVRILVHMVTCVAFLCMETLLHSKYISENWDTRLKIQLAA